MADSETTRSSQEAQAAIETKMIRQGLHQRSTACPDEVKIRVGNCITVLEQFHYDDEDFCVLIFVGMKWPVMHVSEQGDAMIRFDGVGDIQPILKRDFDKINISQGNMTTLYFPESLQGKRVLFITEDPGSYRVDNSQLQAGVSRLGYRRSRCVDDRSEKGDVPAQ